MKKVRNRMRYITQYHLCRLRIHIYETTIHSLKEHIQTQMQLYVKHIRMSVGMGRKRGMRMGYGVKNKIK